MGGSTGEVPLRQQAERTGKSSNKKMKAKETKHQMSCGNRVPGKEGGEGLAPKTYGYTRPKKQPPNTDAFAKPPYVECGRKNIG